ncbi:sensor histidine kinase [Celerinatantimonas sp. MCCC 1A17872]|uniref:sensor histidine kinase n=1 Tax=Celerinatantimonas sp. MCCC 1A17872 TaxID=3177514 RepID=UPI0038C1F34D
MSLPKTQHKKLYSIKNRLIVSVISLALFAILIALVISYLAARHEIKEVYDARLGQTAKQLLLTIPTRQTQLDKQQKLFNQWMQQLVSRSHRDNDVESKLGHPYELKELVQYYRDGKMFWNTHSSFGSVAHLIAHPGYGYFKVNGQKWRYFQYVAPKVNGHQDMIVVAESEAVRSDIMGKLAMSSGFPLLIIIPLLALIMVVLINRQFRPLVELRRAIGKLDVHQLTPVAISELTLELEPLVSTLNRLLRQLDEAWQRERRFTRTAAHELKTPLAILRINAENAMSSENEEQLKEDLKRILAGIERSDRLIHQLLVLARVESLKPSEQKFTKVALHSLLQNVIAQLVPLALQNDQEIGLDSEQTATIEGDELLLEVLFSNLVDNAIRYSGKQSHISVDLSVEEQFIHVDISDDGSPISDQAREHLFENFYRENPEKGDGAGLGMAICRDIVTIHDASLTLLPFHGLNCFRVSFLKSKVG